MEFREVIDLIFGLNVGVLLDNIKIIILKRI